MSSMRSSSRPPVSSASRCVAAARNRRGRDAARRWASARNEARAKRDRWASGRMAEKRMHEAGAARKPDRRRKRRGGSITPARPSLDESSAGRGRRRRCARRTPNSSARLLEHRRPAAAAAARTGLCRPRGDHRLAAGVGRQRQRDLRPAGGGAQRRSRPRGWRRRPTRTCAAAAFGPEDPRAERRGRGDRRRQPRSRGPRGARRRRTRIARSSR